MTTFEYFANLGADDARELSVIVHGLLGPEYFREIADVVNAGGPPDVARIMDVMRRHGLRPARLAGLRSSIAALSIIVSRAEAVKVHASLPDRQVLAVERVQSSMQMGMQQVKEAALADLDVIARAEPSSDAKGYELWLAKSAVDYEGWLATPYADGVSRDPQLQIGVATRSSELQRTTRGTARGYFTAVLPSDTACS